MKFQYKAGKLKENCLPKEIFASRVPEYRLIFFAVSNPTLRVLSQLSALESGPIDREI